MVGEAVRFSAPEYVPDRNSRFKDHPAEAVELRGNGVSVDQRRAFMRKLLRKLLAEGGTSDRHVFEAEALHLIAFTLSAQIEPGEQIRLLGPAITQLTRLGRRDQTLHRYLGLLLRTLSMASSKMDGYSGAYADITRAHMAITHNPGEDPARRWEAEQQIYLQECGQLSRLVETALIEQNPVHQQLMLQHEVLPTRRAPEHLASLRVVAHAAAEAGRRACVLVDKINPDNDMISGGDRRLSMRTWFPTANIMYTRALLLAATIDRLCGVRDEQHMRAVPDRYAAVVECGLKPNNPLDLHRIVLHFAFLNNGIHPYAAATAPDRLLLQGSALPDSLVRPAGFQADVESCAAALEKAGQNANFLDNVGDARTFMLLQNSSGNGTLSYVSWLQRRRERLRAAAEKDPQTLIEQTRQARRSTASMVPRTAHAIRVYGRYDAMLARM